LPIFPAPPGRPGGTAAPGQSARNRRRAPAAGAYADLIAQGDGIKPARTPLSLKSRLLGGCHDPAPGPGKRTV